jgi:uncharacterized lipoprotein YddW (UPF0748 family)
MNLAISSQSSQIVQAADTNYTKETRAVWIATIYSLNFPNVRNDIEAQKNQYIQYLDELKDMGINTIVFQVRPKADAFYKSSINPWSEFLTGTQGQDPGYDPLEFMIEETHKRGMEFHAWLNPYRVTTKGQTNLNALSKNHPARLHPDWILEYDNALYYNPELEDVRNHIVDTVKEIVSNYNVDAIHFDDYFYPSNYPLPDGEYGDGEADNHRRDNINKMVAAVHNAIKEINSDVKFGISPSGIWKNSSSDSTGSNTNGYEAFYSVAADSRAWIKNGWIDYIVPQIYWETGNRAADYETLVNWWSNEVKGTNVKLYVGHGVYKDVVANEIDTQMQINTKYPEVSGSFYYGVQNILDNVNGCKDKIQNASIDTELNQAIDSASSLVTTALNNETFYDYNMAYVAIMNLPNESDNVKTELQNKLSSIALKVWTSEIKSINSKLDNMVNTKSARLYDEIEKQINLSTLKQVDKDYLSNELATWGKQLVWTDDYKLAVEKIINAWQRKTTTSIQDAKKAISDVVLADNKAYLNSEVDKIFNSIN